LPFPVSGAPQRSSKKSVARVILRDCADNHIKERVNQSLTTDQRTTMSPIKNELLPSPKVVTPIHPELIKHYLVGYDKPSTNFLFTGFTQGIRIPYEGNRKFRFNRNLPSATTKVDILKQKISKEVTAGRASGLFEERPLPNIQVSPLGLVPKKNPGEFRVIHHLSYPENEYINSGIPESKCTVKYQTIEDAVKLMKFYGKGCLLSKTDIENSFKIIPTHPDDHELLGFSLGDQYYFDKTLPMGLSFSCKCFETFSTAVHWIIDHKLGGSGCVHYLDDFSFCRAS
jgi:hypothetical protein